MKRAYLLHQMTYFLYLVKEFTGVINIEYYTQTQLLALNIRLLPFFYLLLFYPVIYKGSPTLIASILRFDFLIIVATSEGVLPL